MGLAALWDCLLVLFPISIIFFVFAHGEFVWCCGGMYAFFLYLRVFLSLVIYSFCYVWEELLLVLLGFGWALEYVSV
jgi:hypothetical protein